MIFFRIIGVLEELLGFAKNASKDREKGDVGQPECDQCGIKQGSYGGKRKKVAGMTQKEMKKRSWVTILNRYG